MKNIKTKPLYTILIILLCLLTSLSVSADFQKGFEAAQRGDYATALREWKPLAEQGDVSAQSNLGVMYRNGEGVPEDDVYAYMWWNFAAAQGHKNSSHNKNILSKEMTSSQIEEAQRLSRERMKKDYKNC